MHGATFDGPMEEAIGEQLAAVWPNVFGVQQVTGSGRPWVELVVAAVMTPLRDSAERDNDSQLVVYFGKYDDCTGCRADDGLLQHDGNTCPIHENRTR